MHEDKRHSYQDGDFVKFIEVEGMTEVNNIDPVEIQVTGPYSFKLKLDTSKFNGYTGQGVVEDIKVPKKVEFKHIEETIMDPASVTAEGFLMPVNMSHMGLQRSEHLHLGIMSIHIFANKHDCNYPQNTKEDLDQVIEIAKGINAKRKDSGKVDAIEEIDESVIRNLAAFSSCSISPLAAFFGGIVAQEIVKFTGKYTPLK